MLLRPRLKPPALALPVGPRRGGPALDRRTAGISPGWMLGGIVLGAGLAPADLGTCQLAGRFGGRCLEGPSAAGRERRLGLAGQRPAGADRRPPARATPPCCHRGCTGPSRPSGAACGPPCARTAASTVIWCLSGSRVGAARRWRCGPGQRRGAGPLAGGLARGPGRTAQHAAPGRGELQLSAQALTLATGGGGWRLQGTRPG